MEFGNLGKHCSICRHQDFLPYSCHRCKKDFCKEHRNHGCLEEHLGDKVGNQCRGGCIDPPCAVPKCRSKLFNDNKCRQCNETFCAEHRWHDVHTRLIKNRH